MTLDQDISIRYHFSAEGGSLRTEDGGRTWTKATREDIDRDFKRAEGDAPTGLGSGTEAGPATPSAPTLEVKRYRAALKFYAERDDINNYVAVAALSDLPEQEES